MDTRQKINALAASLGIQSPVAVRPCANRGVVASVGRYGQYGDDEATALRLLLDEARGSVTNTLARAVAELAEHERCMARLRVYVDGMVAALDATEE